MKKHIILKDAKDFNELLLSNDYENVRNYNSSFNMVAHGYGKRWSNGWCPVSRIVKIDGIMYGRISNELVPEGIYNECVIR